MKLFGAIIVSIVAATFAAPAIESGKYDPKKYNQDSVPPGRAQGGYYRNAISSGKYIPMNDRFYMHVDDMRDLGRYIHIPYPYDGGYGPYFGMPNPYIHQDDLRVPYNPNTDPQIPYIHQTDGIPYVHQTDGIPYVHQTDANGYEQVSSGSALYPNVEGYDIPTPKIPLTYGFPEHTPKSLGNPQKQFDSELPPPLVEAPVEYSNQAAVDILDASALSSENGAARTIPVSRQKRSIIDYSQPPTSTRPRTRYDDEGKWKIIRQEENKEQQKYDYFFETENGIFAQEAGKASGKDESGTSGEGWYQYIGDDGKVYRVEYEVGPQGFVPKGDHIHKAITKSLEAVKDRNVI